MKKNLTITVLIIISVLSIAFGYYQKYALSDMKPGQLNMKDSPEK